MSIIRTCESCQLYEQNSKNNDINTLRYQTFCRSPKQNDLLPPCKYSLFQPLQRSNYQAYVWKDSLIPMQLLLSPVIYCWTKEDEEDEELQPELMTQESVPMKIVELLSCQCKASMCKTGRCKCSKNGMKCTPACICEGQKETCQNPNNEDEKKDQGQARVKLRVILKKTISNQSSNL